jgi:hypothetical protein
MCGATARGPIRQVTGVRVPPMNWWGTSTLFLRPCVMRFWCWRKPRGAVLFPAATLAARRQQKPDADRAAQKENGQCLQRIV